jgi:hypothetical protein
VEVLLEKAKEPMRVDFYVSPQLEAEKVVAAQVSGRGDTLVVDAGVWDDVLSLARRLKAAPATPAPAPGTVVPGGVDAPRR